jgi:hypothetical protein
MTSASDGWELAGCTIGVPTSRPVVVSSKVCAAVRITCSPARLSVSDITECQNRDHYRSCVAVTLSRPFHNSACRGVCPDVKCRCLLRPQSRPPLIASLAILRELARVPDPHARSQCHERTRQVEAQRWVLVLYSVVGNRIECVEPSCSAHTHIRAAE